MKSLSNDVSQLGAKLFVSLKLWFREHWESVTSIAIGVAATVYYTAHPEKATSQIQSIAHLCQWLVKTFFIYLSLPLIGLITVLAIICYKLKRKLDQFSEYICYTKQGKSRWEDLGIVRYGHLAYEPFLKYSPINRMPEGFGLELLRKLLMPPASDLKKNRVERNWGNILDGLVDDVYDIVATPLFHTFERSRKVRFSSPLFFSNIGLYVKSETVKGHNWTKGMTVLEMKTALSGANDLSFIVVNGEISEKLTSKYAKQNKIILSEDSVLRCSVFDDIANSVDPHPKYAFFCESFYARIHPKVMDGTVVNLLGPHQILYPVCFAMRMGDYQLANLLNIRLLEYAHKHADTYGVFGELRKTLRAQDASLKDAEISQHFVSQWPCSENGIES
jgi:hypothetical protein